MKDKNSIINYAQKLTVKGQIDKAILEWEKLLSEGKDGNVYNTIGDLYLRKGADESALDSFTKAAEIFRKDGFYPKAIAIYKKMLNIAPNNLDALMSLAKLNADRGLVGNAIDNYYKAAEIFNRDGSTEKATMVVEKMLHLSPTDLNTRSRIAHLYFRIGLRERAANEYASIASTYLENNNTEKAVEFFDKALEYDEGNISALIGKSKLAVRSNKHDQAFDALDLALSHDPDNREVLMTYARLAIDSGKRDDAQRVLAVLTDLEPENRETKKLLGSFHIQQGNHEDAWEELTPVIDEYIEAEKWAGAKELLDQFKELYPLPAGQRLLRISRAQGDDNEVESKLKELALLHEEAGESEEALNLYKEANELNPDDSVSADKVRELQNTLGIGQSQEEKPAEEMSAAEENISSIPAYNEISFPETGDAMSEPADAGVSRVEADGMQESFSLPDSPDNAYSLPEPEPTDEVSSLSSSEGGMSAEEFAAKKAEADFFAQQGLGEEAAKLYQTLLSAFPEDQEISGKLEALKSKDSGGKEISIEKVPEDEPVTPSGADADLQSLFNRFENGDDEKVDYEAHYTSGLEHKQKGLLDEAVKELRIAAEDPEKRQRNTTMLALCYMDMGAYSMAINEFSKVLDTMHPSDSTYLHVKYELARAHMHNQEHVRALELFSEVREQNSEFKDVSEKVNSLKSQISSVREDRDKPKRDRVSYI